MTRPSRFVLIAGACVLAAASVVTAQTPAPKPAPPPVPVKVDVVISRSQGDKKLASMPYSLYMNAVAPGIDPMSTRGGIINVRIGADVPTGGQSSSTSQQGVTTTHPEFTYVGTSIDCGASQTDDGAFRVYVSIQDSSIYGVDGAARTLPRIVDPVAIRKYQTQNTVTVRPGQPTTFNVSTDPLTGETIKAEVSLTVVK